MQSLDWVIHHGAFADSLIMLYVIFYAFVNVISITPLRSSSPRLRL